MNIFADNARKSAIVMVKGMRAENAQFTESYWIRYVARAMEPTGNIHFHSDLEFYYPVSGVKACLLDDRVVDIQARDMIIIYPNQIHKFVRNDEEIYERHVVVTKMGFLDEIQENNELLSVLHQAQRAGINRITLSEANHWELMEMLTEYYYIEGTASATRRKLLCAQVVVFICDLLKGQMQEKEELVYNKSVEPILDYINLHYREVECNLDSIAAGCSLSKHYLCDLFKRSTAMTINNYLQSRRILCAKELLAEGYNVTETAEMAGFSDDGNFIRVFKKYIGITPKQYQIMRRDAK
ncbi:MAG: AraC family transcriptional regulator [Firmicutes bacterium]|nr:AraC family transcriptional regulator [Bacillota bacterium]